MNNPNPFVPKGSILEQQSKRRSRLKLAVFCVLAVSVAGLAAMLIEGCKRTPPPDAADATPAIDTNAPAIADTNPPAIDTNAPVVMPPVATNPPVVVAPPPVAPASTEYTIIEHDTFGKIAKKFGVTVKALEAANPGVVPTKLKVGEKISIPAGGGSAPAAAMDSTGAGAGGEVYVVKSGDNLTRIAHAHGTTVRAIKSENGLTTDHIKVGQKLKIPVKAEAAAPAAATPEPVTPVATPVAPMSTPGTTSTN
jgi:LysM repeat protein